MGFDERIDALLEQGRFVEQGAQQRQVGRRADNDEFRRRTPCALHEAREILAVDMHDELGEQGVERGMHTVTGRGGGIDADAGAGGRFEAAEGSAGGPYRAVLVQGFGIDAQLHRVTARRRRRDEAEIGETRALGHGELQGDEVETQDGLGHGVFDLQARVGFDEEVGARIEIDQEFERAEPR